MAITKVSWDYNTSTRTTEELFAGRVVRIEKRVETRNWSDTMDYTDHRSTDCIYALVWLGTHNVPPTTYRDDPRPMIDSTIVSGPFKYSSNPQPRDLEFFEQFAWVDCTNIFSDRYGMHLTPKVDGADFVFGDPLMWANLLAWESYQDSMVKARAEEARKAAAAREEARKAAEAAAAAKAAKKEARTEATKAAAEVAFARIPEKGTVVTVDGFTGTVFWKGMSTYRNKWNARAGVKDSKGTVQWIPAEKFA